MSTLLKVLPGVAVLVVAALSFAAAPAKDGDPVLVGTVWKGKLTQKGEFMGGGGVPPEFDCEFTITKRDGNPITLRRPYVDPALCIGCGICEHECPVTDEAAIRVSAVGETRSRDRRLLMDGGVTSAVTDLEKRQR